MMYNQMKRVYTVKIVQLGVSSLLPGHHSKAFFFDDD